MIKKITLSFALILSLPSLALADTGDEACSFGQMMWSGGHMSGFGGSMGFLGLLTYLLVIIFLVLGIAYFWKEINKKK